MNFSAQDIQAVVQAVVQAVAGLAPIALLVVVICQLGLARRLSRAQFIHALERDIAGYMDTYSRLDMGGDWATWTDKQLTPKEFAQLATYTNAYVKLFFLIDKQRVLSPEDAWALFGDRFMVMYENPLVRARLLEDKRHGQHFKEVHKLYHAFCDAKSIARSRVQESSPGQSSVGGSSES